MFPSITPPTDSLYKFISLFGLTIFLFSVFILSETYQKASTVDVKLENVFYDKIIGNQIDCRVSNKISIRPFKRTIGNIQNARLRLDKLNISFNKKIPFYVKLNSIEVEAISFHRRIISYWLMLASGIGLVIFGYFRWHHKEQDRRDQMLQLDLEIKEYELKKLIYENEKKFKF